MSTKYGLAPLPSGSLLDLMTSTSANSEPLPFKLTKRAEFFLGEMIEAGPTGITTNDYPGGRVGDAVHNRRKAGVRIETQYEQHGGEFAGQHGRYVLPSRVIRLPDSTEDLANARGRHDTHSGGAHA